jgi:hypothetical protein
MFNWTTTTILNEMPSVKDYGNGKLRIGKHLFEKRWVESIRKATPYNYELCEATLDMTKVATAVGDAKVARLYVYVGLEGSEESIYANDWYRKGMPLSVSFAVGTASEMAAAIVAMVKRFNIFTKVKKVLDVTASGSTLTIKGTHEYQRLQKIAILVEKPGENGFTTGEETPVLEWTLSEARYAATEEGMGASEYVTKTGVTLVKAGVNGFGTYSQLTKDLRLPTAANTSWTTTNTEIPVVGALYTQYIIKYYAPSMANPSFTAIGNRSMSETTHVFWVKDTVVSAWETELNKLDPEGDGLNTAQKTVVETTATRSTNKKQSLVDRVTNLETSN